MRRRWAGIGAVALALAGCGGSGGRAAPTSVAPATTAAAPATAVTTTAPAAPSTAGFAATSSSAATTAAARPTTTTAAGTTVAATTTAAATTAAPAAAAAPAVVVRAVALTDADLPAGARFAMIEQGDAVDGQVSLDACSARFTTEALRAARYQQVARAADGSFVVNDENLVYRDADAAGQALQELRDVVAACPAGYVPPVLQGQSALRYRYTPIPEADLAAAVADRVGWTFEASDRTGKTASGTVVYQRRGRVLVALYGRDAPSLLPYVGPAAARLRALPPADAGE